MFGRKTKWYLRLVCPEEYRYVSVKYLKLGMEVFEDLLEILGYKDVSRRNFVGDVTKIMRVEYG